MAEGTTTTNTAGTLPEYLSPYVSDLFARSQALTANNPSPVYNGTQVAGLTQGQQNVGTALSGLGAAANMTTGTGLINQGANYTPNQGAFDLAAAQQYMNPYQQGVTDIATREARRNDLIAQTGRDSAAAQAGAFGGSRHGVIEAEAQRNLQQRLGDITTQGLNTSYQNAMQQYNADQNRQQQDTQFGAQAAIKGGEALQTAGAQQVGLQNQAGLLEQQTNQRQLGSDYQNWLNQQQHPYDQLTFMRNTMSGFPGSSSTVTRQESPASNWASDLMGIGNFVGQAKNAFGWAKGGQVKPQSGLGHGRVAQLYGSLK